MIWSQPMPSLRSAMARTASGPSGKRARAARRARRSRCRARSSCGRVSKEPASEPLPCCPYIGRAGHALPATLVGSCLTSRKAMNAAAAKAAPARKVASAPILSHSRPASTLAIRLASPVTRPNSPKRRAAQAVRRGRRDQRREHALGEPHMQPPQADAEKDGEQATSRRPARGRRRSARSRPTQQQRPRADPVLEPARRIGACRIDEAHHRDDRRRPGQREAPSLARG